jgi:hypothetical protein
MVLEIVMIDGVDRAREARLNHRGVATINSLL